MQYDLDFILKNILLCKLYSLQMSTNVYSVSRLRTIRQITSAEKYILELEHKLVLRSEVTPLQIVNKSEI